MRVFALLLLATVFVGCKAPGVGELEGRVDELEAASNYDDSELVDRVDYVEQEVEVLDQRVTSLEMGQVAEIPDQAMPQQPSEPDQTPQQVTPADREPVEIPIPAMEDIPGLLDSLNSLKTMMQDSVMAMNESTMVLTLTIDSLNTSMDSLNVRMDSLSVANDSLRTQLDELAEQVQDLSYTVDNMRYTGSTSGTERGSTSSTGGTSGGRGSTSGTTTGGGTSGTTGGR